MVYSRVTLAVLGFTVASAAYADAVKWVPLKSVNANTLSKPKASQRAEHTTSAVSPVPAPAAVPIPIQQPLLTAAVAAGTNSPLQIMCLGAGTANKAAVATAYSGGTFSGIAGTTTFGGSIGGTSTIIGSRQQGFSDQVDIRLFSGDDRIRLPRTMLPPIHGGADGWFKLKDVVADARTIRASAAINFMSNPKIYIDRLTGTISISGRAGDYAGQCQSVDAAAAPKF
jgi:hypothetical protein